MLVLDHGPDEHRGAAVVIFNCNELWTRMIHVVYRIRGKEVLTPNPPPPRRRR